MELVDSQPLLEWFANNYKTFGEILIRSFRGCSRVTRCFISGNLNPIHSLGMLIMLDHTPS